MIKQPQDLELLSAFLDDELTPAERATLERRLQREPALAEELDSLRQTVNLVRQMPIRKAPRSFALTPALVDSPSKVIRLAVSSQPIRPSWRVYAPLAAILVAALIGVGLFASFSNLDSQQASESVGRAEEVAFSAATATNSAMSGQTIFVTESAPTGLSANNPTATSPVVSNTIFVTEVAIAASPTSLASPTALNTLALPQATATLSLEQPADDTSLADSGDSAMNEEAPGVLEIMGATGGGGGDSAIPDGVNAYSASPAVADPLFGGSSNAVPPPAPTQSATLQVAQANPGPMSAPQVAGEAGAAFESESDQAVMDEETRRTPSSLAIQVLWQTVRDFVARFFRLG
jgi:hypothetical protein